MKIFQGEYLLFEVKLLLTSLNDMLCYHFPILLKPAHIKHSTSVDVACFTLPAQCIHEAQDMELLCLRHQYFDEICKSLNHLEMLLRLAINRFGVNSVIARLLFPKIFCQPAFPSSDTKLLIAGSFENWQV